MSTGKMQRFWFGELPKPYYFPLAAQAKLFVLQYNVRGQPDLQAFYWDQRGSHRLAISRKLGRLPAPQVFEALRWEALVEGYVATDAPVAVEEFDSGKEHCELHVGRRVATPDARAGAPHGAGWKQLADWPRSQRRLICQVDATGVNLMSFGPETALWEEWTRIERDLILISAAIMRRGCKSDTPRMLIDTLFTTPGELWLLDLLALDGRPLTQMPFAVRQQLLTQEVSELRGENIDPGGLRLWSQQPIGSSSIWARAGATYGRDLVQVP